MKKVTSYIITLSILFCGIFQLYRYSLDSNDLTKIEGKILSKKIEVVSSKKGSNRYGMIFEIENIEKKFGIYIGTANHVEKNNDLFRLIDTGKIYTLLIDPTVSSRDGVNLGVHEIYFKEKRVFVASKKFDLFLGVFFTLLGLTGLIVLMKVKKTK